MLSSFAALFISACLLSSCSSSINQTNVSALATQYATNGKDSPNQISVFWYEESLRDPRSLSETVLIDGKVQSQAQYFWRNNTLREVYRKSDVIIDGVEKKQFLQIRYDPSGNATYQQYRLDGDILPIPTPELQTYYQQGNQKLLQTKQLKQQGNSQFIQGQWSVGEFIPCGDDMPKRLSFNEKNSSKISQFKEQNAFILASGDVNRQHYFAEHILLVEDITTECLLRPIF